MTGARRETVRQIMRYVMAAFYFAAGVAHLRSPSAFLTIMPPWVPYPEAVVAFTGVCELAGSIGLLTVRFRWWAGVMLAAYAVCVFPANIRHAVEGLKVGSTTLGLGYHIPRLLFQPVLVWWALFVGGVVDWPWKSAADPKQ